MDSAVRETLERLGDPKDIPEEAWRWARATADAGWVGVPREDALRLFVRAIDERKREAKKRFPNCPWAFVLADHMFLSPDLGAEYREPTKGAP